MNGPAFRLQPLIKLREAERDHRRLALAKAHQAEQILAQQIGQILTAASQAREDLHVLSQPGLLNVDQLLDGHRYKSLLKLQRRELERHKEQLRGEIEKRRLALMEADRQLKTLEKLQERRQAEQLAAQHKIEMRQLDETALRKHQLKDPRSSNQSLA